MHYVNFSYNSSQQNLIACQIDSDIYFYTIKPIPPNTELLVWYSREYAERLNVPKTGEEMLQAWSKSNYHHWVFTPLSWTYRLKDWIFWHFALSCFVGFVSTNKIFSEIVTKDRTGNFHYKGIRCGCLTRNVCGDTVLGIRKLKLPLLGTYDT